MGKASDRFTIKYKLMFPNVLTNHHVTIEFRFLVITGRYVNSIIAVLDEVIDGLTQTAT